MKFLQNKLLQTKLLNKETSCIGVQKDMGNWNISEIDDLTPLPRQQKILIFFNFLFLENVQKVTDQTKISFFLNTFGAMGLEEFFEGLFLLNFSLGLNRVSLGQNHISKFRRKKNFKNSSRTS